MNTVAYESPNFLKILCHSVFNAFAKAGDYGSRSNRIEAFFGYYVLAAGADMLNSLANAMFPEILARALGKDLFETSVHSASLIFLLPLFVRRLHDFDYSGWWMALALSPIPLSLFFRATGIDWFEGNGQARLIVDTSNLGWLNLIFISGFAILFLAPGTDGPNRFGDPS